MPHDSDVDPEDQTRVDELKKTLIVTVADLLEKGVNFTEIDEWLQEIADGDL